MKKVKIKIHNKIVAIGINDMICRDCVYKFNSEGALGVLNCKKFTFGKPYAPVLLKNRCDEYKKEGE